MNFENTLQQAASTENTKPRIEQLSGKYDAESMILKLELLPPSIVTELDQVLNSVGMSLVEVGEHKNEWLTDTETNRVISSHIGSIYLHLTDAKIVSTIVREIAKELQKASME